jgi:hypothetical protein
VWFEHQRGVCHLDLDTRQDLLGDQLESCNIVQRRPFKVKQTIPGRSVRAPLSLHRGWPLLPPFEQAAAKRTEGGRDITTSLSTDRASRPFPIGCRPSQRLVEALIAAAQLYTARAEAKGGAVMLSFVEKLQREQGYRLAPPLQAIVDDLRSALHARLSDTAFAVYWDQGQSITLAELLGGFRATVS